MVERSQNKRSVLQGPTLPVPISPLFSYLDTWSVSSVDVKYWLIEIPPDGMVYKLCNFHHSMIPTGWVYSAIYLNDDIIWNQFEGWTQKWSPGSERAYNFVFPDVIKVGIGHVYSSYSVTHYWQIDFWREPQRS